MRIGERAPSESTGSGTPANRNPPGPPADNDPQKNQGPTTELQEIARGERWLIGVGIVSVIVNIGLGFIYYLQLTQMQIATRVSREATQLAYESLMYAASEFDRSMIQSTSQSASAFNAAHSAEKADNVAQQSLDVSNRPWLAVGLSQQSALVFNEHGASISVQFKIKNVGHSPANRTEYSASIVTLPHKTWMVVELKEAERRECGLVSSHYFVGSGTLVPTIFPGEQPMVPDWPASITEKAIQQNLETIPGPLKVKGKIELYVVACVAYRTSYSSDVRHSSYGFAIGTPKDGAYIGYVAPQGSYSDVRLMYLDSFAD